MDLGSSVKAPVGTAGMYLVQEVLWPDEAGQLVGQQGLQDKREPEQVRRAQQDWQEATVPGSGDRSSARCRSGGRRTTGKAWWLGCWPAGRVRTRTAAR